MINQTLPVPQFFDESKVGEIWQVPYSQRTKDAREWKKQYSDQFNSFTSDSPNVNLILVDVQNTFCIPTGELYVGGRSGTGAIDDNIRLCKYIYENLPNITTISPSLDTHRSIAIFHEIFWVNSNGEHPAPGVTMISVNDVKDGVWKVNPEITGVSGKSYATLQKYALDYVRTLEKNLKYQLLIWPYHGMLLGIGHALVSAVEEAVFFHSIIKGTMPDIQLKGENPFSESYSILGPEVRNSFNKGQKNTKFIKSLLSSDIIIIAGQAKSHCVYSTIEDLLSEIQSRDPYLAKKVYILEDCMSSVVIPGVIDFTDQADKAFEKFIDAGMNIINSETPIYNL